MKIDNPNLGLLIVRVSLSVFMFFHGFHKIFSSTSCLEKVLESYGLPYFLVYCVYLAEVVAPVFIALGFRTRLFSVIFSFNMLMAILLVHSHKVLKFNEYGGSRIEVQALYMLGALALVFTGAGRYSVSSNHSLD